MLGRFRRLNDTLPYLMAGIMLYGVVVQLAAVWFVEDKIGYSIGVWYGVFIAMWMAYNLAKVIYDSVMMDSRRKVLVAKSLLRYFVVVILLLMFGYFKFGNIYTAIIGVFGLKVAAYLVPVIAKLVYKFTGKEAPFLKNEENSEENLIKEVTM